MFVPVIEPVSTATRAFGSGVGSVGAPVVTTPSRTVVGGILGVDGSCEADLFSDDRPIRCRSAPLSDSNVFSAINFPVPSRIGAGTYCRPVPTATNIAVALAASRIIQLRTTVLAFLELLAMVTAALGAACSQVPARRLFRLSGLDTISPNKFLSNSSGTSAILIEPKSQPNDEGPYRDSQKLLSNGFPTPLLPTTA